MTGVGNVVMEIETQLSDSEILKLGAEVADGWAQLKQMETAYFGSRAQPGATVLQLAHMLAYVVIQFSWACISRCQMRHTCTDKSYRWQRYQIHHNLRYFPICEAHQIMTKCLGISWSLSHW